MSNDREPFLSIASTALDDVNGGAARVASGGSSSDSNDALLTMLTSISSSIKDMSSNSSNDMMPMMMMMMMMGGMGGGGGGAVVAAPPPPPAAQPTYVNVNVDASAKQLPCRAGLSARSVRLQIRAPAGGVAVPARDRVSSPHRVPPEFR